MTEEEHLDLTTPETEGNTQAVLGCMMMAVILLMSLGLLAVLTLSFLGIYYLIG